jgi:hypothetical protein
VRLHNLIILGIEPKKVSFIAIVGHIVPCV